MPSITGGSSSSLDYAPHMYVLREGGDSHREGDYIYVGNAEATYEDDTQYGDTYDSRLATIAKRASAAVYNHYHIGISEIEGLVGDVRTHKLEVTINGGKSWLASSLIPGGHRGIPALEIPKAAKKELIKVGLEEIATLSGHIILGGLGIELPHDLEPLDFGLLFNGTPKEQATEQAKNERWRTVASELHQTLEIE